MLSDADLVVSISSLSQFLFCPRRCALMFVEHIFEDNHFTVEGSLAHEVVDDPGHETRGVERFEDALPLFSDRLKIVGKADRVEWRQGVPFPLEFKRGRGTDFENNFVQLCAQALCLEEMFRCDVSEGAVFHIMSHRREPVVFDAALRAKTNETITQVRELIAHGGVPKARLEKKCNGCSLREVCVPEIAEPATEGRIRRLETQLWRGQ